MGKHPSKPDSGDAPSNCVAAAYKTTFCNFPKGVKRSNIRGPFHVPKGLIQSATVRAVVTHYDVPQSCLWRVSTENLYRGSSDARALLSKRKRKLC